MYKWIVHYVTISLLEGMFHHPACAMFCLERPMGPMGYPIFRKPLFVWLNSLLSSQEMDFEPYLGGSDVKSYG